MTKKLTKKEQAAKLKEKITLLKEGIASEESKLERYCKQVENWIEFTEMKIEGVRAGRIEPEFPHHKNKRFWQLQANEMQYTYEEQKASQEGQKAAFAYKIEALTQEIKTLTAEIKKLEGKKK